MKEKFAKLFGALLLVALVLGLVMPFQTAAAQEEVPASVVPSITATGGLTTTPGGGVVLEPTGKSGDTSIFAPVLKWNLFRSETETGAKVPLATNVTAVSGGIPGAYTYTYPVAGTYEDLTAVDGTVYWYWAQLCDVTSCSAYSTGATGWAWVPQAATAIGATTAASGLYEKIIVTVTNGSALTLPGNGGYYQIYRKKAAMPTAIADDKLGKTTSETYNDLTAAGKLPDGTAAPLYGYAVDTCGKDKCATDNKPTATAIVAMAAATGQRNYLGDFTVQGTNPTVPNTAMVYSVSGANKVTVYWPGMPNATIYYAERLFGSLVQPATPLSWPALTLPLGDVNTSRYNGEDTYAVTPNTYAYRVWACVTPGTTNCTTKAVVYGWAKETPPVVSTFAVSKGDANDPSTAKPTTGVAITFTGLPASSTMWYQYKLFRADNAAGTSNVVITPLDGINTPTPGAPMLYFDNIVDPGVSYYYWLQVCDWGTTNCSKTPILEGWGRIPAPKNFSISFDSTGVSGKWDAVAGSNVFYQGFRANSNSITGAAGPKNLTITSGTDTTGTVGVTYWYFIKACVGTRCSLPTDGIPGTKLAP